MNRVPLTHLDNALQSLAYALNNLPEGEEFFAQTLRAVWEVSKLKTLLENMPAKAPKTPVETCN